MKRFLATLAQRLLLPVLRRGNARSVWWQYGMFPVRSRVKIGSVHIAGQDIEIGFPPDEEERQRWEIEHLFYDDPYAMGMIAQEEVRTIVDVGANIGVFSMMARHRFPQTKIVAYEPSAKVQGYLRANLSGLDVGVRSVAVGLTGGYGLVKNDGISLCGYVEPQALGDVEIISVEEMISEVGHRIDICKLDCEGAEWEILKSDKLLANTSRILMEFHPDPSGKADITWLVGRLKSAGFRILNLRESVILGVGQLHAAKPISS